MQSGLMIIDFIEIIVIMDITCSEYAGLIEPVQCRLSKEIANGQMGVMEGVVVGIAGTVGGRSLDFACLDADHRCNSVVKDIKMLHKKVKDGGAIQFNG